MVLVAGRTHRLAGWNAYDWSRSYRYQSTGWGTITPTPGAKTCLLTFGGQPPGSNTATDQHRVLWGIKSGYGYERSTRWIAGTTATARLLDLQPGTYYAIRLWRFADGSIACSPEFSFTAT